MVEDEEAKLGVGGAERDFEKYEVGSRVEQGWKGERVKACRRFGLYCSSTVQREPLPKFYKKK